MAADQFDRDGTGAETSFIVALLQEPANHRHIAGVEVILPILLRRLGVDPATSSTPFIASLIDVTGILIFVNIAQVIMADVITKFDVVH